MAKYRKKPVVIEAMQFTDDTKDAVWAWTANHGDIGTDFENGEPVVKIMTPEGEMVARLGDWIIKGIKGEFYPCKPDIFEATYERIDDD